MGVEDQLFRRNDLMHRGGRCGPPGQNLVDPHRAQQYRHLQAELFADEIVERGGVLGQAGAAVRPTTSRSVRRIPHALGRARDRPADHQGVDAELLADEVELVEERDLGRVVEVVCVLDHLGCRAVDRHDRCAEWRVELAQDLRLGLTVGAEHGHPWFQEILVRADLAEKLRIHRQTERVADHGDRRGPEVTAGPC